MRCSHIPSAALAPSAVRCNARSRLASNQTDSTEGSKAHSRTPSRPHQHHLQRELEGLEDERVGRARRAAEFQKGLEEAAGAERDAVAADGREARLRAEQRRRELEQRRVDVGGRRRWRAGRRRRRGRAARRRRHRPAEPARERGRELGRTAERLEHRAARQPAERAAAIERDGRGLGGRGRAAAARAAAAAAAAPRARRAAAAAAAHQRWQQRGVDRAHQPRRAALQAAERQRADGVRLALARVRVRVRGGVRAQGSLEKGQAFELEALRAEGRGARERERARGRARARA
jgi:hypothetical protein